LANVHASRPPSAAYAAGFNTKVGVFSGCSTIQRATGFPVAGSMDHVSKHLGVARLVSRVFVSVVGSKVIAFSLFASTPA
jgi:hypothetical protein